LAYIERVIRNFEKRQFFSPTERNLLPELVRVLPMDPLPGRDSFLILDVGSGPTTRLGTRIPGEPGAQVVPIDVRANEYLTALKRRGLVAPVEPIQMRAEDAESLFDEGQFDLIVLRNVIHELENPPRTVMSLTRLLRPGSSLMIFAHTDERFSRYGTISRWSLELTTDNINLRRRPRSRPRSWQRPFRSLRPRRRSARLTPVFEPCPGVTAKSRHRPAASFAKLQVRRDGLDRRQVHLEWERGKKTTMRFWSERAANPSAFPGFVTRFDPDMPLMDGIAKHLPSGNDPVRILDVGSGPATNIGHRLKDRDVELICIDVMADHFNKMLASYGLHAPVPPIFGRAEDVDQQFGRNSFDIVFSRNALDHVAEPITALRSMLAATKRDGCVIVWGHVNEGEPNYRGYHQWNFCWEKDEFIIWRPGYRKVVRGIFGEHVNLKSEGTEDLYRIIISRRTIS
jgi:SAM-dependent methyltransferase